MANASTKRIAAANEATLKALARNLLLINALSLAVRYMKARLRVRSLVPPAVPLALNVLGFAATVFLWRWFVAIGSPRRDAAGNLKSAGDDLAAKGIIELAWDVIYMTWICTLGSALLGNWVWWLYLAVPAFGLYKAWGIVQPFAAMLLPGVFGPRQPRAAGEQEPAGGAAPGGQSKRQAKLQARMERGDKRVQQQQVRRG